MDGDDQAIIDRPVYDGPTETLWLAGNLRSTPISVESWTYQHGSYLVLRDFLERRQGRMLTSNEFHEFRLLSAAVEMTLELLPKVDAAMRAVVETGSVLTAEELRLAQVIGEE